MATGITAAAHVWVVAVAAATTGGLVEVKADSLGSARFSRSILSSKWRSTGLVRPKGEAMPGVQEPWSRGGETWPPSGVRKATKALLTDAETIASIAVRCAGLRDCCAVETGSSGPSGSSCPNISSNEEDEKLSDRALSSGS